MVAERERIVPYLAADPDRTLALVAGAAPGRGKLVDRATGTEGRDIEWRFRVGDQVKIRLVDETGSHHPFHVHGAGRFLVLARDGFPEPNLVWKDTVLVPAGRTVDLLLDVDNPGRRRAHAPIADHHEATTILTLTVDP